MSSPPLVAIIKRPRLAVCSEGGASTAKARRHSGRGQNERPPAAQAARRPVDGKGQGLYTLACPAATSDALCTATCVSHRLRVALNYMYWQSGRTFTSFAWRCKVLDSEWQAKGNNGPLPLVSTISCMVIDWLRGRGAFCARQIMTLFGPLR